MTEESKRTKGVMWCVDQSICRVLHMSFPTPRSQNARHPPNLSTYISQETTPKEAQRQTASVGNFYGPLEAFSDKRMSIRRYDVVFIHHRCLPRSTLVRLVETFPRSSYYHRTDPRRLVHQENGLFKHIKLPKPSMRARRRPILPSKRGDDAPYPDQGYIAHLPLSFQCTAKLTALRTANGRLLFQASQPVGATQPICEIGVMAVSGDQEKRADLKHGGYTAVLTIPTGIGRNWTLAAKGESRESMVAALQSLFEVTATALEKYQGNVFRSPTSPSEVAGGLIDESLVKTSKVSSWTSMFGSWFGGPTRLFQPRIRPKPIAGVGAAAFIDERSIRTVAETCER
jgi:hypothetical protein